MSRWEKQQGRSGKERNRDHAFPVWIDLVRGRLSARVHAHEIETDMGVILCWSYITDGLHVYGQRELVYTLQREENEASNVFPQDPLYLFQTVLQLAQQGTLVESGGFTEFGARKFFGHHVAYVDAQPLRGVNVPDRGLAMLLVTEEELTAIKEFGITRVAARLGAKAHYYPVPPWTERTRTGISFAREREVSVLSRVPRVNMHKVYVSKEENLIIMRVPANVREQMRQYLEQVPADAVWAILTGLDPKADGCLVWEAGQAEPTAITPPLSTGSRIGGCFVLFVPQQKTDEIRLFEDGFALMITDKTWADIRAALGGNNPISVSGGNTGLDFSIEWIGEEGQPTSN